MQKIKISAVSYLNTLPFIYGLQHDPDIQHRIDLQLDMPSVCAQKLLHQEVDLGLVPVAIIPALDQAEIVSDYCIGADGKVDTVLLLGHVPKEHMQHIQLDYQSRSSVQLVQVLAREYWQIAPTWQQATVGFENKVGPNDGAVIIGDRTFNFEKPFCYQYDLAEEWKNFTGLPFVFAAWVANKSLDPEFIQLFNNALSLGIQNINKTLTHFQKKIGLPLALIDHYLKERIQFKLDDTKRKAMEKFWELAAHNEMNTTKLLGTAIK